MLNLNIKSWEDRIDNECSRLEQAQLNSEQTSLALYGISKDLFDAIKNQNKEFTESKKLYRLGYLARSQLSYYKSKLHFIEQFFSALFNLFTRGEFSSTAFLAKKMTQQLIKQLEKKERAAKLLAQKEKSKMTPQPDIKKSEKDVFIIPEIKKEGLPVQLPPTIELTKKEALIHALSDTKDAYAPIIENFWQSILYKAEITQWKKYNNKFMILLLKPVSYSISGLWSVTLAQKIDLFFLNLKDIKKIILSNGVSGPLGYKLAEMIFQKNDNTSYQISLIAKGILNDKRTADFDGEVFIKHLKGLS
jgi:hypothetical protein